MKLVVGLGNPGPKYETTRHNAGFLALDRLVDVWSARSVQAKTQAELYQAEVCGEKVLLMKPLTFMNLSGRAVAPVFRFHKCAPEDLIVIHDDLDLKPVTLRLKTGGGAGGHNGLKSIDQSLGAEQTGYHRVRIGVGHPRMFNSPLEPADYVLQPFSDDELTRLDPLLDQAAKAVALLIQGQAPAAMNEFNRKE